MRSQKTKYHQKGAGVEMIINISFVAMSSFWFGEKLSSRGSSYMFRSSNMTIRNLLTISTAVIFFECSTQTFRAGIFWKGGTAVSPSDCNPNECPWSRPPEVGDVFQELGGAARRSGDGSLHWMSLFVFVAASSGARDSGGIASKRYAVSGHACSRDLHRVLKLLALLEMLGW